MSLFFVSATKRATVSLVRRLRLKPNHSLRLSLVVGARILRLAAIVELHDSAGEFHKIDIG